MRQSTDDALGPGLRANSYTTHCERGYNWWYSHRGNVP